ncbi:MAG: response regulator transcription factor [Dehalococcoidia bacterium]
MQRGRGLNHQDSTPIRIVLVDDHPLPRRAIRRALEADPRLSVVGEGSSGLDALQLARRLKPRVIVMDISMPVMSGFEATRILKEEMPDVQVILVSAVYSAAEAKPEAKRAGASLFLSKLSNVYSDWVPAIKHVCRLSARKSRGCGGFA